MRATRAIIYLGNLRHNFYQIKKQVSNAKILAAVKADAYGHGAVQIAKTLVQEGCDYLGVATVQEAWELRQAQIKIPILLLGIPMFDEISEAFNLDVTFVVSDLDMLNAIGNTSRGLSRSIPLHLKIDVGMGRLGVTLDQAAFLARAIKRYPHLFWEGVMTHFPSSDNSQLEPTRSQNQLFLDFVKFLGSEGVEPSLIHAANSGAVLDHPDTYHSMVRPGILLYGYPPSIDHPSRKNFYPVMQLESRVVLIKKLKAGQTLSYGQTYSLKHDSNVGVVAIGYADGYSRIFSNCAFVRIGKELYQVSGRVCMDQFMIDLGNQTQVERWDQVVLFGPYANGPDAWDLAQLMKSIPYEVTCLVSKRVPRIYSENSAYFS